MGDFVKCNCQHCGGHIEFEREMLTPWNSAVSCPHCGLNTFLYIPVATPPPLPTVTQSPIPEDRQPESSQAPITQPSAEGPATGYQKAILRSLDIFEENDLRVLNERKADDMIAASRVYNELLRSLREYGLLRERIPVPIQQSLFQFTLRDNPSEKVFLNFIRNKFPEILLSKNYGRTKSRRNEDQRKWGKMGEFAPPVYVDQMPVRRPDDPDATPAQKRFLRDLGVRDESVLAGLGKNAASQLIQKVLDERRSHGI